MEGNRQALVEKYGDSQAIIAEHIIGVRFEYSSGRVVIVRISDGTYRLRPDTKWHIVWLRSPMTSQAHDEAIGMMELELAMRAWLAQE